MGTLYQWYLTMASISIQKLSLENISLKLFPLVPSRFASFSQYSDFFPFICNTNLTTVVYALNYSFFLQPESKQSESVIISIYDRDGNFIRYFSHDLDRTSLFTPIDLSLYLNSDCSGSFTIYHQIDHRFMRLSSVYADRSYISFVNSDSNFHHFVHGNQDSFVYSSDHKVFRGIRPSLIPRIYRPQFTFESDTIYTLIFSNPSKSSLYYLIRCVDQRSHAFYRYFLIPPMGTNFLKLPAHPNSFYISIIGNHPFPRPVIMIGSLTHLFDIFHS